MVAGSENSDSSGAVTVTDREAVVIGVKPGADAETTVVPGPVGSNVMPSVVGELNCPGAMITVPVCAVPAGVVSCATPGFELEMVTVTPPPPIRGACRLFSPELL